MQSKEKMGPPNTRPDPSVLISQKPGSHCLLSPLPPPHFDNPDKDRHEEIDVCTPGDIEEGEGNSCDRQDREDERFCLVFRELLLIYMFGDKLRIADHVPPLQDRQDPDDEEVKFENNCRVEVEREEPGEVGREGDQCYETEGEDIYGDKGLVRRAEVVEPDMVDPPERREQDKRDEIIDEIREEVDQDGVDRKRTSKVCRARDLKRRDQQSHGERVDRVNQVFDPVLAEQIEPVIIPAVRSIRSTLHSFRHLFLMR